MRKLIAISVLLLLCRPVTAAVTNNPKHPYVQEYKKKTFGKSALAPVLGGASIRELRNSPHEWGRGPAGFAKRVGSSFGTHVIKNSIEYTVAGIRHEDLHYYRSEKPGFGPRLRHALVSTVVTHKTTTGKKTMASGRLSGAFGSGLVASAWQPAGFSVAGGAASGGISLGASAAANVAREFWPRHKSNQIARR